MTETTPLVNLNVNSNANINSYTKSKNSKLALLGIFIMFSIGGICSGFSALKPAFIDMGVFHYICTNQTEKECVSQILRINWIGQVTFATLNVLVLPIGFLMDRIALSKLVLVGNVLTILSVATFGIFMNFRILDQHFWWVSIACFVLIGLAQLPTYFATIELFSFLPEKYETLLNSTLSCAWDLSALVFMLFNFIYFKLKIPLIYIFCIYAACMIPFMILFVYMYNRKSLKNTSEAIYVSPNSAVSDQTPCGVEIQSQQIQQTLKSQILSKMYISLVIYTAVTMLHFYFFMSTAYDQAMWVTFGNVTRADFLNTSFSIIFPAMAIVSPFLIAWLLKNMYRMLIAQMCMGIVFGVCTFFQVESMQFIAYIFFGPWRIAVFIVVWYFSLKAFGKTNYGVLISTCFFISGVFTLTSPLINSFVAHQLNGNFRAINIIFTITSFLATFQFLFVYHKNKKIIV